MKLINKKGEGTGFTLSEFLQFLLAMVVLGLLIFGLVKGISVIRNQDGDNAKSRIDVVEGKIDAFESGQKDKFILQGFEPKNEAWVITGWSYGEEGRPDKCAFNSCVCACKMIKENKNSISSSCQEDGFCRLLDKETISIKTIDCNPEDVDAYGIVIPNGVAELTLEKTKDKISLSNIINEKCSSSPSNPILAGS